MQFVINKRHIHCANDSLVGDNADYIATFVFDSEWDDVVKTARFTKGYSYVDVLLENDSCKIPMEVLKEGYIRVGVYSSTMTTTYCLVHVNESIKERHGNPVAPTQDVYQQIMKMIEGLEVAGVTDAQIEKAIRDYLEENPITGVDEAEVQRIVKEYVEAHKDELKGDGGFTNTKSILSMTINLKPIPQTDTNLGITRTTRYTDTTTEIVNPIIVPSVIDGIINPKLLHVYGSHSVQVVEGSETPKDYYIKADDNGLHNGSPVLSFGFDGDEIEVIIHSYATVRILVDDGSGYKYTSEAEDLWLKGAYERTKKVAVKLNFGSAKQRNIVLEMGLGDEFGGFIHNRVYSVTPISEKKPLACFIGSSLTDGQGKHITWSRHVCHRLGLEWLNVAQGATGFVNNASGYGGRDKVRNRMPLIYPKKPWLLTLEGSYNDMGGGISISEFKEELNLLFAEVKENLPNCLTVVIGTFTPCRDLKVSGHWDAKNDALREVALQHNLPFIDGLNGKVYDSKGNILSNGESWLTGSGNEAEPKGDGNSDLYVISDSTHFNDAGNTYLGELITSAISEIIYSEKVHTEASTEAVFNLSKNFLVLNSGSSVELTYFPATTNPTFVSSNDLIATVSANGTVSGISEGVVMISATVNGVTDTCVINVVGVVERGNVTGISATKTKLNYAVGDTITLDDIEVIATYENGSTSKVTTWTTNADSIDMSTSGTKTLTISYEENGVVVTTDITLSVVEEPIQGDIQPIMLNMSFKNDGTILSTERPRMYLFKLEKDTTYYLNATADTTEYIRTAFSDTELSISDTVTLTKYYKNLKNQVIQAPSNMTNFYINHSNVDAVITLSTEQK